MHRLGSHVGRRAFGLCLGLCLAAFGGRANAEPLTLDASEATIVRVRVDAGDVVVKTWDRAAVQVDGDPSFTAQRKSFRIADPPPDFVVLAVNAETPRGPVALPSESFVVSSVAAGPHEAIRIDGTGPLTVTVPNTAPLVIVKIGRGRLVMHDYRGGTFLVQVRNGAAFFSNVGGDGFVQVVNGPIVAVDSTFNRLRARTALRDVVFERCHAKQIEATTVEGSIVYDNGSFASGLARFESANGNVAIGIGSGNVQIGARSGSARIFTSFDRRVAVDNRTTEATANIGSGGPVVTATTGGGAVFLYEGSLRNKRRLGSEWREPHAALRNQVTPPRHRRL